MELFLCSLPAERLVWDVAPASPLLGLMQQLGVPDRFLLRDHSQNSHKWWGGNSATVLCWLGLTSGVTALSVASWRAKREFCPEHLLSVAQVWWGSPGNGEFVLWAVNETKTSKVENWNPVLHLCPELIGRVFSTDLKCAFNEQKRKQHFKVMNQLHVCFLETELQMYSATVLEMRNRRNIWRAALTGQKGRWENAFCKGCESATALLSLSRFKLSLLAQPFGLCMVNFAGSKWFSIPYPCQSSGVTFRTWGNIRFLSWGGFFLLVLFSSLSEASPGWFNWADRNLETSCVIAFESSSHCVWCFDLNN